jgi:hypothetical protein
MSKLTAEQMIATLTLLGWEPRGGPSSTVRNQYLMHQNMAMNQVTVLFVDSDMQPHAADLPLWTLKYYEPIEWDMFADAELTALLREVVRREQA